MEQTHVRAPMHLWIVGILSLLWNLIGALDYTMSQMRNMTYLKGMGGMTDQQIAYLDTLPTWAITLWALGVWGAVAGSLLLLMRKRAAVGTFLMSLLGLIGSTFFQYTAADMPAEMRTTGAMGFTAFLWIVAIALLVYARNMRAKGVIS